MPVKNMPKTRTIDWSAVRRDKEKGHIFTYDQVIDVMQLVLDGEIPNGEYSDDECVLWSILKRMTKN